MQTNATNAEKRTADDQICDVCGTTSRRVDTYSFQSDLIDDLVDACPTCAPAGGRDPVAWYREEVQQ